MKKTYMKPAVAVVPVSTTALLNVSGNFEVTETTASDVYDEEINGGDAW
jgi:hypothetical protein